MKRFKKHLLLGAATSLVFLTGAALYFLGPYHFRVEHHPAAPGLGYSADFYLYVSPKARDMAQSGLPLTILVQPNNSGTNSDDPGVHLKDAWWMGFGRHFLANDLGVALLVPAFVRPGEDWHIYTHALDRDVLTTQRPDLARLDLQLLAMIETASTSLEKEGLTVNPKVLIQGYSASGMFANRFTLLHPDRVLAAAAGSPGGWPIAPVSTVNGEALIYPAGIADLEELTGAAFDTTAYREVPQLLVMGSLDDNDSLEFIDGWEPESAEKIIRLFGENPVSRWSSAESMYKQITPNARFVLVEGVGHDRRKLQSYSTDFFKEILARQVP